MAFVVTARHAGGPITTSVQTLATNSTTPTASSLLLVFGGKQSDNDGTVSSWQLPVGGSLTYTQVDVSGDFAWAGDGAYLQSACCWRAPVGGSPGAHTVTVDAYSGANLAWYNALAVDITGHNTTTPVVQSADNGANLGSVGDSHSGTVTLGSTPSVGNLVVVFFTAGNDVSGAFTAPTIGGQAMVEKHNQSGGFCHGGVWVREITGAESNNVITCTDLGQSVGNYAAVAVEIALAAGGTPTVSPSAIATGEAFGSPTLTPGSVSVSPGSVASAESFGTPALSASGQLLPTGIGSEEAFGALSVSPGTVIAAPVGIATAEVFGSPVLVPGTATVSVSALSSLEAFGVLSISNTGTTLAPDGVGSEEAFGTPALQPGSVTMSPGGIAPAEAFGQPSLTVAEPTWRLRPPGDCRKLAHAGLAANKAYPRANSVWG